VNANNRIALALAAVITAAAWILTVRSAASMAISMPMPGGWSMSMAWMGMPGTSAAARAIMFLVMWDVMMVAMMLPSVMPAALLHGKVIENRVRQGEPAGGSQVLLLVGYFAVWTAFGAVAFAAGTAISLAAMKYVEVSRLVPAATGATLVAAGLYQLTRLKQACLQHCRSPLHFFSTRPLRSAADSLKFGLHHGAYCAACCWGLMAIQLALGVMSLPLMIGVAGVIFIEKQWRYGERFARVVGAVTIVAGVLLGVRFVLS
jgi:predicted metal-binding membrane protein